MIGIINAEDLEKKDGYTRFYVVNPKDLFQAWRGDNFGEKLIPIIKEHKKELNLKNNQY